MDNKFITQINSLIEQGRELLGKNDFSPEYYTWRNDVESFLDKECDPVTAKASKHSEDKADYRRTVDGQRMELIQLKERILADTKI
jgi:hypothetical protein